MTALVSTSVLLSEANIAINKTDDASKGSVGDAFDKIAKKCEEDNKKTDVILPTSNGNDGPSSASVDTENDED